MTHERTAGFAVSATPPPDNELVIGLVGAVGIDLPRISTSISVVLTGFDYRVHEIHLSSALTRLSWDQELVPDPLDEHISSYMTAGDKLCSPDCWDRKDAFALLAIHGIALQRQLTAGDIDVPLDREAYTVRSLKRPEEVALLRQVYGSRFILIAAYSPATCRRAFLENRIKESRTKPHSPAPISTAEALMARDEKEHLIWGQNVLGTFHLADIFIDASDLDAKLATAEREGSGTSELKHRAELKRCFEILFGHPNRTPSRDEFGIFQAAAAMRRSAELGRQVGAAICTSDGDVVAVGANEVPKAGGGLYWEGDKGDRREFRLGRDTSDQRKREIAEQVVRRLATADLLIDGADDEAVLQEIARTDIDNLIEYIRAVHAEMAAITDSARRGIAVEGCTIYVTTFPCHHCARHIVAAGIQRAVYVAPYAKSMAEDLHSDSIVVASEPNEEDDRVRFEPFVGLGPRRYLELFEAPERKDQKTGKVHEFEPTKAQPRLSDLDPIDLRRDYLHYIRRERLAQELLRSITDERDPKLVDEPPPAVPLEDSAPSADKGLGK